MAASAFLIYNKAKKAIGNGTIVLGTTTLKCKLARSASNASSFSLSTFASVTSEISATGGYVAGGVALAGLSWTVGASAKEYKFAATNLVIHASGGPLTNVKFAVIGHSGGAILCWSKLSTAQFTVPSGTALTIAFSSQGIFTLT